MFRVSGLSVQCWVSVAQFNADSVVIRRSFSLSADDITVQGNLVRCAHFCLVGVLVRASSALYVSGPFSLALLPSPFCIAEHAANMFWPSLLGCLLPFCRPSYLAVSCSAVPSLKQITMLLPNFLRWFVHILYRNDSL